MMNCSVIPRMDCSILEGHISHLFPVHFPPCSFLPSKDLWVFIPNPKHSLYWDREQLPPSQFLWEERLLLMRVLSTDTGDATINHRLNQHCDHMGNLCWLLKLLCHENEFINSSVMPVGHQLGYGMNLLMCICTREVRIKNCALDYFFQCFNSVLDGIHRHQSCKFESEFKAMTT
jgi:hypothetical protein